MKRPFCSKSFTIIELMVVVVLISIIASLAIKQQHTIIRRAQERRIVVNLETISARLEIFRARQGAFPTQDLTDLDAINAFLEMNVLDGYAAYEYDGNPGWTDYELSADTPDPGGYFMHVHPGARPHCSTVDNCPTCVNSHDPVYSCL